MSTNSLCTESSLQWLLQSHKMGCRLARRGHGQCQRVVVDRTSGRAGRGGGGGVCEDRWAGVAAENGRAVPESREYQADSDCVLAGKFGRGQKKVCAASELFGGEGAFGWAEVDRSDCGRFGEDIGGGD